MSASYALQKALVALLDGASLSAPVYDGTPAAKPYPRIEIGEGNFSPENADKITAREERIRITVYDRSNSQIAPCKVIVDELFELINETTLVLDNPYAAASECQVVVPRIARKQDGITVEGVLIISAIVQTVV